jgi:hypothetical protein
VARRSRCRRRMPVEGSANGRSPTLSRAGRCADIGHPRRPPPSLPLWSFELGNTLAVGGDADRTDGGAQGGNRKQPAATMMRVIRWSRLSAHKIMSD